MEGLPYFTLLIDRLRELPCEVSGERRIWFEYHFEPHMVLFVVLGPHLRKASRPCEQDRALGRARASCCFVQ